MERFAAVVLLIGLPLLLGCPSKSGVPSSESSANGTEVSSSGGSDSSAGSGGSSAEPSSDPEKSDLSGRITLAGDMPGPRKIQITKDGETCGTVGEVLDVEGTGGGVTGVVVEIRGVKPEGDWDWKVPKDGYVIRQKACAFVPKLLVIPNGQNVTVHNDDPVGHNVNTGSWNQMQPAGADPIVEIVEGKSAIKIGCNVHSWMEGWLYPAESPFYAVTEKDGSYEIKGIPPGKYRVSIWHSHLGRAQERMTLEAGVASTLDHQYDAVSD